MVARALVEGQIRQGAQLLHLLDATGIPIEAAYWMLASEWSDWWLVLVTPRADETGPDRVSLQIIELSRTLDDWEYLMSNLGIVGPDHYWARAFRKKLPHGPPKPGYWLGDFFDRDSNLEVLDSYVYRLTPSGKQAANGTATKRRTPRNGAATEQRPRATSDASQEPSGIPG
jgi:hypothetical protein